MATRKKKKTAQSSDGLKKVDFIAPHDVDDRDERPDAMTAQEEYVGPPVRFGSVPVENEPLGWDRRRGFRKLFPQVMLHFQGVQRDQLGHPSFEPKRLLRGNNLHVMRRQPRQSITMSYIAPHASPAGSGSTTPSSAIRTSHDPSRTSPSSPGACVERIGSRKRARMNSVPFSSALSEDSFKGVREAYVAIAFVPFSRGGSRHQGFRVRVFYSRLGTGARPAMASRKEACPPPFFRLAISELVVAYLRSPEVQFTLNQQSLCRPALLAVAFTKRFPHQ